MDTCYFCDKPGPIVCDAPACQQFDKDLEDERKERWRSMVRTGVRNAIVERCKDHDNWCLSRGARWFYVLKLLTCVTIRRICPSQKGYPEQVEVAVIYSQKTYAGWEAGWITVGRGVFSGWWYDVFEDSDWNM